MNTPHLKSLAAAALSLSLTLAACGSTPAPTETPTATPTASSEQAWVSGETGLASQSIAAGTNNLTRVPWTSATNGWGPIEIDRSNGEQAAGDGRTLTLQGKTYTSGFGTNAASSMTFDLGGRCATFTTGMGIDDEVGNAGSVVFQIYADGTLLYDSGRMTGKSQTKNASVSVSGKKLLRLVVTDAGDGPTSDHADWVSPTLLSCTATTTVSAPAPSVSAVSVTPDAATVATGATAQLQASVSASGGASTAVTWTTSAAGVATVSSTGLVTAVAAGSATITATSVADSTKKASATITVSAPALTVAPERFLSELPWTSSTNAWGPVERDMSNGEDLAGDGRTLTLQGVTHAKGLGVHAGSTIVYPLDGTYSSFKADVGLDDEVGAQGNASFQVWVDGTLRFDSGEMTGDSATQKPFVDIRGARELKLVVNAGTTPDFDHADWAGARLSTELAPAPTPTLAPAPSTGTTTYSGPLVISKGGTYSGNWESPDTGPAVSIQTTEPVIIENANIRGKGVL
ncbi:NPCBM/NEW2 domain-containing protein, partial [Deinococcus malanensis]|uniref:NPCBM/NEW2 domain-containing protein n=1 Tax=Deinococcus malanensis TaxID=1706855 RepID=UPI00166663C0